MDDPMPGFTPGPNAIGLQVRGTDVLIPNAHVVGGMMRRSLEDYLGRDAVPVAQVIGYAGGNTFYKGQEAALERAASDSQQRIEDAAARRLADVSAHGMSPLPGGGYGGFRSIFSGIDDHLEFAYYQKYETYKRGSQGRLAMNVAISQNRAQGFAANVVISSVTLPFALEAGWSSYRNLSSLESGLELFRAPETLKSASDALRSYEFNMIENPGPLAALRGNPAANFAGGRYNAIKLSEDLVLSRAGQAGGGRNAFGQYFTRVAPVSRAQVHIDGAVKTQWLDNQGILTGESNINAVYQLRIPAGTTVYEGPIAYQGGVYLGGLDRIQVFVPEPWSIPGVQVVGNPLGTPIP
jgi:hypothetical protein